MEARFLYGTACPALLNFSPMVDMSSHAIVHPYLDVMDIEISYWDTLSF